MLPTQPIDQTTEEDIQDSLLPFEKLVTAENDSEKTYYDLFTTDGSLALVYTYTKCLSNAKYINNASVQCKVMNRSTGELIVKSKVEEETNWGG